MVVAGWEGCSLQPQGLLEPSHVAPLTLKPPMRPQASQYVREDSKCWVILMPDMGFTGLSWKTLAQNGRTLRVGCIQAKLGPTLGSLAAEVLLVFLLDSGQGGSDPSTLRIFPVFPSAR